MYLRRPAAVRPGLVQGAIASSLELCTQNRPILKGLLIIVRPPDIQPISLVDDDTDTLPIGDHFQHQLVETERLVFRNQIENFFVDAIDAHAHAIRYPGLLLEPGQISVGTHLQHAIVYRLLTGCGGYRKELFAVPVVVEEAVEGQIGQDISVHDQEIVGQVRNQAQRRHGAERFILHRIVDFDIPPAAVAEEGTNDFGLVIDGKRDVRESAGDQLPDDDFEDGSIADRHQRLRQRDRERMQAGSPSTGEYYGAPHGCWLIGRISAGSDACLVPFLPPAFGLHGSCVAIAKRSSVWLPLFSTSRKPVTSQSADSEGSSPASGRDRKPWLASCCAFAAALLLLGAMLWTLFEKNLVSTMTQQGWSRELYGMSAALTKLRFG